MTAAPDRLELRSALGRFATGVAIVTTLDGNGSPIGLTINSFSSVSLDPPLVLWSLVSTSHNLSAFRAAGRFAVNVLSHDQADLALRFARPVADRFGDALVQAGLGDLPLLSGALATIECDTHEILAGGDHTIFMGRVKRVRQFHGQPLLFYGGRFAEMGAARASRTLETA